jgi:dGTPase
MEKRQARADLGDIGFGYRPRAPYACDPARSRGRLFSEIESPTRTAFQRDRDRIIHSTAFRRLKHKTQVFIAEEGDHYRTRLTHSIEVAQIARALARALRGDEDLAEAIALVHDFGHTPFGHTGEEALNGKMAEWGGFDHNAQSLRIVTRLERRYAEFDGLNLTWETLEGLVKHNGPLIDARGQGLKGPVPRTIRDYCALHDLGIDRFAGIEAQCAAIADDIAYNTHDRRRLAFGLSDAADAETGLPAGFDSGGCVRTLSRPRSCPHRTRTDAPTDHAYGRGRDRHRRRQSCTPEAAKRSRCAGCG